MQQQRHNNVRVSMNVWVQTVIIIANAYCWKGAINLSRLEQWFMVWLLWGSIEWWAVLPCCVLSKILQISKKKKMDLNIRNVSSLSLARMLLHRRNYPLLCVFLRVLHQVGPAGWVSCYNPVNGLPRMTETSSEYQNPAFLVRGTYFRVKDGDVQQRLVQGWSWGLSFTIIR